jgi:hypothetical protein
MIAHQEGKVVLEKEKEYSSYLDDLNYILLLKNNEIYNIII